MKKNRIINMTLSERKELNVISSEVIKKSIELDVKKIESSLELLEKLQIEREIVEEENTESHMPNDVLGNIFEVDYEIPNEIVSINCKIMPSNYFTLQPYSAHINLKNNILYGLSEFIKSNYRSEKWDNSLCIFAIKNEIRTTDLDNYYCKPFLDAIVLSKLITSDSYENTRLIYTKNKSNNSIMNIKILNRNHMEKYKDLILKELD